jgi:hypothetical protein
VNGCCAARPGKIICQNLEGNAMQFFVTQFSLGATSYGFYANIKLKNLNQQFTKYFTGIVEE